MSTFEILFTDSNSCIGNSARELLELHQMKTSTNKGSGSRNRPGLLMRARPLMQAYTWQTSTASYRDSRQAMKWPILRMYDCLVRCFDGCEIPGKVRRGFNSS